MAKTERYGKSILADAFSARGKKRITHSDKGKINGIRREFVTFDEFGQYGRYEVDTKTKRYKKRS